VTSAAGAASGGHAWEGQRAAGRGVPPEALLAGLVALGLVALPVLFAVFGENRLIDTTSILLVAGQLLVLLLRTTAVAERRHPVMLVFVLFAFLFFPLRTMALIIDPRGLYDQFLAPATSGDMHHALEYALAGIVCSGCGIIVGARIAHRWSGPARDGRLGIDVRPVLSVVAASLLLIVIELNRVYEHLYIGMDRHSEVARHLSHFWKFYYTVLDIDTGLMVLLVLAVAQWRSLGRGVRTLALVAIVGYAATRIVISSKAAVFLIVVFWFFAWLAQDREHRISRAMIALVLPLMVIGVLSFNGAKAIRQHWEATRNQQLTLYDTYRDLDAVPPASYLNIVPFFNRLEGIDPLVNVVNDKGRDTRAHVNLFNEGKSLVSHLLPWHPFPIAWMAQEYAVVFGHQREELYISGAWYTTYIWTLWGEFYVLFGGVGGLVASAVVMGGLAALYGVAGRLSGVTGMFARFLCLYATYSLLLSFGLDFFGWQLLQIAAAGTFFLGVVWLVPHLWKRAVTPAVG